MTFLESTSMSISSTITENPMRISENNISKPGDHLRNNNRDAWKSNKNGEVDESWENKSNMLKLMRLNRRFKVEMEVHLPYVC